MIYWWSYIVCIVSIAISPSALYAINEPDCVTIYNTAGSLYRDGQFHGALALYDSLIADGIKNSDLFYNASNAAYRTGSLGKAILYLERSLNLAPSDHDALSNLTFLNSKKQDQEPSHSNVIIEYLSGYYNTLTINSIALFSVISFALGMLVLTLILFVQRWKRLLCITIVGLTGVVFLLSTGMLIEKIHYKATVIEAVVMDEEAHAYSGPGTENTHIFTLHEGTKIVVGRSQDSWNLIRLKSGAGGWIKAETMERI